MTEDVSLEVEREKRRVRRNAFKARGGKRRPETCSQCRHFNKWEATLLAQGVCEVHHCLRGAWEAACDEFDSRN